MEDNTDLLGSSELRSSSGSASVYNALLLMLASKVQSFVSTRGSLQVLRLWMQVEVFVAMQTQRLCDRFADTDRVPTSVMPSKATVPMADSNVSPYIPLAFLNTTALHVTPTKLANGILRRT